MSGWWTAVAIGIVLVTGQPLVAEEDDPFAEELPPPISAQEAISLPIPALQPPAPEPPTFDVSTSEPVVTTPPVSTRSEPIVMPIVPRRPVSPAEPTLAQQRVQERAAEEARQRKARIEQRRHGAVPATQTFFPSSGPLANPSLFQIDPGIRIAYRPIQQSGLQPLPNVRPQLGAPHRKPTPTPVKPRSASRAETESSAENAVSPTKP